jgi:hypothetical protein
MDNEMDNIYFSLNEARTSGYGPFIKVTVWSRRKQS